MTDPTPPIPPLTGPAWGPLKPGPARHLVVLLHGLGADGSDLIDLAPHWAAAAPHARFVAPNAPFPCDMAPYGRQWYSLQDRSPPVILAGAERAAPALNAFIDAELRSLGLTPDRLVLMGFSQGTMMALHRADGVFCQSQGDVVESIPDLAYVIPALGSLWPSGRTQT